VRSRRVRLAVPSGAHADGASTGHAQPGGSIPRTLYGLFLRNLMLRRPEARDRAQAEVERAGSVDAEGLLAAMLTVLVNALFGSGSDVRQIRRYIAFIRDWLGPEAVPQLEAEALVRAELGDREVPVNDISDEVSWRLTMSLAVGATETLQLTEIQVDELVAHAEDLAAKRGFHPTPIGEAAP
jgi:hypothetical protein